MASKSNKAFSLLEVLITVAILSTAIVFVFQSFTASLSSSKFSQNITLACYLVESKLWEIEQKQKQDTKPLEPAQGAEKIQGRDFNWSYEIKELDSALPELEQLTLTLSWEEKRENPYTLEFSTYLLKK